MKLAAGRNRALRMAIVFGLAAAIGGQLASPALAAGSLPVTTCGAFVFNHAAAAGITTSIFCPPGTNAPPGMTIGTSSNKVKAGQRGSWQATAPTGLSIVGASIPANSMYSIHVNDGQGWGGGFYWKGGGAGTHDSETSYNVSGLNSSYFGLQLVCGWSVCNNPTNPPQLTVETINLQATETQGPWLSAPDGLWQASGWVRGNWRLDFSGDSPSGICSYSAAFAGSALSGPTSSPNTLAWHQCSAPAFSQVVSTAAFGQGPLALTLTGVDAAGVSGSVSKTVYVDNSSPSIALSGPQDAPVSDGVQYVTAAASAGPAGVAGIACSLDRAPDQWYSGASARVAVQGLGVHQLTCSSAGGAHDASGNAAWSAPATWTLSIRQPSVSIVSFVRIVHALRCAKVRERVRIPPHWVTGSHHGRPIRIKLPAQTRTITVVHCHPLVVRRRVRVHGRWRTVSRVLLPHVVRESTKRIRHGKRATISGWLGTPQGIALAGQQVRIMTAADNGQERFRQAALVSTLADGSWSARLPAGPSRIVQALYDGASSVEPAASGRARLIVPASIRLLSIGPRHAHWGERITISGRLRGGYLPAAGERVDVWLAYNGGRADIANTHVTGRGRFKLHYRFASGNGTARYPVWLTSTADSAYPYAPARTRTATVIVSP
jgi:hypothetical protein